MKREHFEQVEFLYEALLRHPHDAWRISPDGQHSLCILRDILAEGYGTSPQEIQDSYEAKRLGG